MILLDYPQNKKAAEKADRQVAALAQKPGRHGLKGGLILAVSGSGAASWTYRYWIDGKAREMGLGSLNFSGLKEAREAIRAFEAQRADGEDPREARAAEKTARRAAEAKATTFRELAEAYMAKRVGDLANAKHRQQWRNTMTTYAYPHLGGLRVAEVAHGDILKVVEPIWQAKNETARRILGRIRLVLDYAEGLELRDGANPAVFGAKLKRALPGKRPRVQARQSLFADIEASVDGIPAAMAALRARMETSARALEWSILTASRAEMTMGARFSEIDDKALVWTIPADRVKQSDRPHRVPITPRMLSILEDQRGLDPDLIFPGTSKTGRLSENTMRKLLQVTLGYAGATPHGVARATFATWRGERTAFSEELGERALAHVEKDKVKGAYARGDLLEARRPMMQAWAAYCASTPSVPG